MIVYRDGRLVQDTTIEQQKKASKLREQAKAEGEARLAGLKKQQKTQASALKKIDSDTNPPKSTGGSGVSATDKALADAQERRRKLQAALAGSTSMEEQSRSASQQALDAIKGIYDPQEADVETQRVKQLQLLADAISGGQSDISKAEADFLRDIVAPTGFKDVPFVGLSQEQNPLLAALQAQGAGTAEVESQRALDAQLANALKGLSERSATQSQASEQAYFEALKNAGRGASLAGRTYLAQRQPEIGAGIESQFADLASKLRTERAGREADVQSTLNDALAQIIADKAKAESDYGPIVPVKKKKAAAAMGGLANIVDGR